MSSAMLKKWLPLVVNPDLTEFELQKLILACANLVELRIGATPQSDKKILEILSSNENEFNEAHAILHQALADMRLRERIVLRSDKSITNLVECILKRSLEE